MDKIVQIFFICCSINNWPKHIRNYHLPIVGHFLDALSYYGSTKAPLKHFYVQVFKKGEFHQTLFTRKMLALLRYHDSRNFRTVWIVGSEPP